MLDNELTCEINISRFQSFSHINCLCAKLNYIQFSVEQLYLEYRKPPIISPGFIQVRKPFLMGLCTGGLYTREGLIHGRHFGFVITVFIVHLYKHENKQKLVCRDKQTNIHYYRYYMYGVPEKCAYIIFGRLILGGGGAPTIYPATVISRS